jgi:uncharacterized protein (DUF1015 family)
VAEVQPFHAVRYDERRAGPLEALVAPPYDVISAEERLRYLARSPYNVVHLTLPDDEQEAARLWETWLAEGVLRQEQEAALWWLAQDFVGPDGVARTRAGLVASLRVEPYESRVVLPHERTHAGPKEGRLRLLQALPVHLEPILLLYEGALSGPAGDPLLRVRLGDVDNRLWRFDGEPPAELAGAQLMIADGHHRYETALAAQVGWMLVVVCPTEQDGLTVFPTHRVAQDVDSLAGEPAGSVEEAFAALPPDRAGAVLYRAGRPAALVGEQGELDTAFVDRLAPRGVTYTPQAEDAVAAVDRGEAEAAFLLRPPTVEQVRAAAERGETMPQKSTYFYPKLTSGLLFQPL